MVCQRKRKNNHGAGGVAPRGGKGLKRSNCCYVKLTPLLYTTFSSIKCVVYTIASTLLRVVQESLARTYTFLFVILTGNRRHFPINLHRQAILEYLVKIMSK